MTEINIYCDESCHLENDGIDVMVLGALWCPKAIARDVADNIRLIKTENGFRAEKELKWTKVQAKHSKLYSDVVSYFFGHPWLKYRGVIIPHKSELRHSEFSQDHETWYYKMYYTALRFLLTPHDSYFIYLDMKDTHSNERALTLQRVLANSIHDFDFERIRRVQPVLSHQVEQIQMVDLLSGAISYANRDEDQLTSKAKAELISQIRSLSNSTLTESSSYNQKKFNLLKWQAEVVEK